MPELTVCSGAEASQTPYGEAFAWIDEHPGTGSALGLSKLILSLWNDECCFSYRECVTSLDAVRSALALRVIVHFEAVGEDQELVDIGHAVCDRYPRLWEQGQAACQARNALQDEWRREDIRAEDRHG